MTIEAMIDGWANVILSHNGNNIPDLIKKNLSIERDIESGTDSYCVSLVYKNKDVRKTLRTVKMKKYDILQKNMPDVIIELLELLIRDIFPRNKNLEEYKKLLEDK